MNVSVTSDLLQHVLAECSAPPEASSNVNRQGCCITRCRVSWMGPPKANIKFSSVSLEGPNLCHGMWVVMVMAEGVTEKLLQNFI